MYEDILQQMQSLVMDLRYVMTAHAREEANSDGLTALDVEAVILTGRVVERQWDEEYGSFKYRVLGRDTVEEEAEVVARLGRGGRVVIITVYAMR